MSKKSTTTFLIFVILWEIAVGLIYGFFIRYNTTALASMNNYTYLYKLATSPTTSSNVYIDTTQSPFPQAVVSIAIILLIVGNYDLM